MLRYQIYIGTIYQLHRISEEEKISNIIFKKKISHHFSKNNTAIDLKTKQEYPLFSNGVLSHHNYIEYNQLQNLERQIVTNEYSLNNYLKNRKYPIFLKSSDIEKILTTELERISDNLAISTILLIRENKLKSFDSEKEKVLIFK